MKSNWVKVWCLVLLFLVSCNSTPPTAAETYPLSLTVEITHDAEYSFKSFRVNAVLKNISDKDLLVQRRLLAVPQAVPAELAEVSLLIYDQNGNVIDKSDATYQYDYPSAVYLGILRAGTQIEKSYRLWDWFFPSEFKAGEEYTIVLIYQNNYEMTKTYSGIPVSSWTGSIRSNEEKFIITP